MDAESLVTALVRLQLAASVAILLVLLLRPLALRWCGAGTAYWLWLVVPLAATAVLLPAPEQVVKVPTVPDLPIVQQQFEPDLDVGITREHAATAPAVQPGVPDERSRSGVLIAVWLLGAGVFLIRSIVNTRRLASSPSTGPALVGVLRPRLVLPQDFEARFNAEERALILAHEEMHRVARHTLVNALVEVARCASWFNPLAHLAAWRFRADQELACDTAVIAAHPEARHTYAQALLKAQVAGVYLPMGCVWTSGTAGRLAERIARLSEQLPGRRRRFAGAASIVGIGIAASYAAWAQQPARVITVQQPNPEGAAVVATELSAPDAPEAVSAPAARAADGSKPSTSQVPRTSITEAPQGASSLGPCQFSIGESFGPRKAEREPGAPAISDGSATCDENTLRRLAVVTGGASATLSSGTVLQHPTVRVKERLKDPEYRKGVRAQMRITIKTDHRGLARKIGLSENEAEKLFDLLADNQVARMEESLILGSPVDQQERQEALRMSRELDRREEESIQALLGDKYAQWQAYQESQLSRSQSRTIGLIVTWMSMKLDQAGKPLTAAQNRAVTTAFTAEQQRQAQERRIRLATPASQAQTVENGGHYLDVIAPHVNADQLVVLREQMERRPADISLRAAFAMDAVIDDRATVDGQPNPTFGKPVCRITRDGVPQLDTNGRPLSDQEELLALAHDCQPLRIQTQLPQQ
jgi:beta-lactamase regulating signal transducer with metallopeptidase domain